MNSLRSVLLLPPVLFIIYLFISYLMLGFFKLTAAKGERLPGKELPYACGQEIAEQKVQPDYGQFFPFAFFFTIMHVVTLVISTVPPATFALPMIYLTVAAVSILILFRR